MTNGKAKLLFDIKDRYENLSTDEVFVIDHVIELGKKYILWEAYTFGIPKQEEASKNLKEFDNEFKKIVKYIK